MTDKNAPRFGLSIRDVQRIIEIMLSHDERVRRSEAQTLARFLSASDVPAILDAPLVEAKDMTGEEWLEAIRRLTEASE